MKPIVVLGLLAAVLNFAAAGDYNKGLEETKEAYPDIIQGTPEVITVCKIFYFKFWRGSQS